MKAFTLIGAMVLIAALTLAQQPGKFYSHEEQVKPSMNAAYYAWLKKVKDVYTSKQVNLTYFVFAQDDNTYFFFSPMEGYDIGMVYKNVADVATKVGNDAFQKLFAERTKYIESQKEYISLALPQYTYLTPEDDDAFRHLMYWIPVDGMDAEVDKIATEWVQLHRSTNAPNGYQTYKTIMGGESAYVIVSWGKDEMDYLTKSAQGNKLMGEEGEKLWARTMAITKRIDHKNAWFMADVSYWPAPPVSVK
jgi:hypothetical protein